MSPPFPLVYEHNGTVCRHSPREVLISHLPNRLLNNATEKMAPDCAGLDGTLRAVNTDAFNMFPAPGNAVQRTGGHNGIKQFPSRSSWFPWELSVVPRSHINRKSFRSPEPNLSRICDPLL